MCWQSAQSPAALSSLPVEPTSQNTEVDELWKQARCTKWRALGFESTTKRNFNDAGQRMQLRRLLAAQLTSGWPTIRDLSHDRLPTDGQASLNSSRQSHLCRQCLKRRFGAKFIEPWKCQRQHDAATVLVRSFQPEDRLALVPEPQIRLRIIRR